jgi:hypothetical protein
VLGTLHAASDWDFRKAKEIPPPAGYASDHCPVAIDLVTSPDKPASAITGEKARSAAGKSEKSDKPDGKKPVASDAGPKGLRSIEGGEAPADAVALATKLQAAGWVYVMPEPKSKAAKWGNKDTRTTWFPGYWKNAKSGGTSVSQPAESDGFKGDGEAKPKWRDGGSPKPPSYVEWLCSNEGGIAPE